MENKQVPKLRFPEFQKTEGWKKMRLGNLSEVITKGSTPTSYGFDYVESGVRFVKIESLSGGFVDCSKTAYITEDCNTSFFRSQLKESDILFSIAGALGVIAIVNSNILPANINQAIGIIRLKKDYSHHFLLHQLQADLIQSEIQRIKAGAAQPNISLSQLGDFVLLLPSTAEQQKIADCLSSLDELMAAQARKVDALKAHKKGLMQQLFPRAGETQPRLRFPEFQNAVEWEILPFNKLFSIGNGRDYKHLSAGDVPVYGSGGYMRSVNEYLYDGESVCIGRKGTINNPMLLTGKFWTVDTLFYTHSFQQCLPQFIYAIFQNIDWLKHNEAGGVPSLSKSNIEKIETAVPRLPEQQKIADCLASLDALITAATQKLETLKTHKKGLMQQLFPSAQAVNE